MKKLFRFLLRAAVAFAVILIALIATAPLWQIRWVKAPSEAVRFEPLGKVVTAAELGPESAFGWLERAVESLDPPIGLRSGASPRWKDELKRLDREKWSDEEFPKLKEALEKNAAALEYAHKAAALPDEVVPTVTTLVAESTYNSGSIRLSQLLQASASRHAARGEYDAMADDLENIARLGLLVSTGGAMLNALVDVAMLRLSAQSAMSLAQQYALPEPINARLIRLFQEMETKLPPCSEVLRHEARAVLNEIDTIYGGGEPTSSHPAVLPRSRITLARLAGSSHESTRQNMRWFLEHLILFADQGDDGTRQEKAMTDLRGMYRGPHSFVLLRDPIGYLFTSLATPAYLGLTTKLQEARCSLRGATLVLALEQDRRDVGRLPAELSELVPKYVPSVPADPYAPETALRFIAKPEASPDYVIYSIGPNQRDERGRLIGKRPSKLEGDLVIYPLPEDKKPSDRRSK